MMAPSKMKLRVRKRDSAGKSSQRLLANASPDSKCPICLDGFNNVASLDRCLHQFCFRCIHEWSKNKAECPLCKQPFHSIFHSVKGENDFKEFVLENNSAAAPAAASAPNAAIFDPPERRLRPRTLRERLRAQQAPPTSPPPALEDAVMFEGLAANQDVQQMVMRLTARGRGQGRSLRRLRDQDVVAFRRALYRTGVRVRCVRDAGRQRDISASFLRQNPGCLRRLLPWLQRELTVLYGSHGSLVNIVQNIIISRIMNYNMEDSAIRDELRPFLLARTDHFLHELVSFARSPLNMEAYDQQAIYDCPAPSYEEGSSSDLSVIAISEDEDDNESEGEVTENRSESLMSQSAWDDETPGPSHSALLPPSSQSQAEGAEPGSSTAPPLSAIDMSSPVSAGVCAGPREDEEEDEEEECLIVGYVKPMAERTPELVQLSSDSSEEEQESVEAPAAVTKSETPHEPQSQVDLPGPGPAAPCSPEPEIDSRRHPLCLQPEENTRSHSRQKHCKRKERKHQRSRSKEKNKRADQSERADQPTDQSHSPQSGSASLSSECSPSQDRHRRRRAKLRRSASSDSDVLRSHRCRKRRRRSVSSSSSADSHSERSCLDKPGGKRKYKTRHLEQAAQRRRRRERSPSVEIIYERRAPDPRRKRRRRKRDARSPTVITIDSDSDRTIDCLDRVMDVIDQTAAEIDATPECDVTLSKRSDLLNPSGRALNLDDCVVDVVDGPRSEGLCAGTAPPSDTRLLQSILQGLEEFLPGAEPPENSPRSGSLDTSEFRGEQEIMEDADEPAEQC